MFATLMSQAGFSTEQWWQMVLISATIGTPVFTNLIQLVVDFCKSFVDSQGNQLIKGNRLLIISLVIGTIFGSTYMFFLNRPPEGDTYTVAAYYMGVAMYGIIQGLWASGQYNQRKNELLRVLGK